MLRSLCVALALVLPVAACSDMSTTEPAVMRWDHRPEAHQWTAASLTALQTYGAVLPQSVPADIDTFCPGYRDASLEERRLFWTGLLSALAKHESTWNPKVAGGGGRWIGLLQISPGTARAYGCKAQDPAALKDGAANLSCAIRIISRTVPRDGVVGASGRGGVAADWGPFTSSEKRADIVAWTSKQTYCQPDRRAFAPPLPDFTPSAG
jgi:hypothetical protein